ncbi:hypothetical protein CHS0354_017332 [Potamilus streckersoni]|uniref:Uncharacterized protein n=1 Tax=Potamilus streckersoni TaxID=2493646 RepID=A0AAE0W770_9BIVA|nr:hypothetical protein CHS0354_017332 [Potamilus streckersoni]
MVKDDERYITTMGRQMEEIQRIPTVDLPPPYSTATGSFQGQQYPGQNNQYSYQPQNNTQYAAYANAQSTQQLPQTNYGFSNMQNTVIVQSPQTVSLQYQVPPPDYTVSAWLACLCCFWPTGLIAIIKAHEANDAAARGDMFAANAAANTARQMVRASIIVGICSIVFAAVFVGVYVGVILNNVSKYD